MSKSKLKTDGQENNEKTLSGAVAKQTPDNQTSGQSNTTNHTRDNSMENDKKQGLKELLSGVALAPDDIPKMKFVTKQTVIKASGSIPKNTFFRVHPDFERIFMMVQSGKGMDSKMYIIGPDIIMPAHLMESVTPIACHLIVFPDGELRILERKTATPGEPLNEYQQSSLNAVNAGKKSWVTRRWNKSAGVYEHVEAAGDYAPSPVWPKEDFMDLLIKAYEGRIIDSNKHAIYQELAGKKAIIDAD